MWTCYDYKMNHMTHLLEELNLAETHIKNFGDALDANPTLHTTKDQLDRIDKRFRFLRNIVDSLQSRIDELRNQLDQDES